MLEVHLAAVDVDAVLSLERLGDVLCGDRAVELFVSSAGYGIFTRTSASFDAISCAAARSVSIL